MSIKKVLILAAAGVASSAALAGGPVKYTAAPTTTAAIPAAANDNRGVYIEGMAGYNQYAFEDNYSISSSANWSHGNGNPAFGAAIGYQFQRYISAELGGIYTLKSKINYAEMLGTTHDSSKVQPWYGYLAAKLSVPVYDNFSVFTKLGVGYQKTKIDDNDALTTGDSVSNWGPMFGAGVAYNITPAIYVDGQWLRFTGKTKDGVVQTTAPNMFLLGVGYKFAM